MRIQRASEGVRHGKTDEEERLLNAFRDVGLGDHAFADMVVCFRCGNYFKNISPGSYPHSCFRCGYLFSERFDHCMPDLLIRCEKIGIVYVNGGVHSKEKVRKRDLAQIQTLKVFGYVPFVIKNDLIDNAENFWLKALADTIYRAIDNPSLYKALCKGEKELVGIN